MFLLALPAGSAAAREWTAPLILRVEQEDGAWPTRTSVFGPFSTEEGKRGGKERFRFRWRTPEEQRVRYVPLLCQCTVTKLGSECVKGTCKLHTCNNASTQQRNSTAHQHHSTIQHNRCRRLTIVICCLSLTQPSVTSVLKCAWLRII